MGKVLEAQIDLKAGRVFGKYDPCGRQVGGTACESYKHNGGIR
jgi:hypothetical protein